MAAATEKPRTIEGFQQLAQEEEMPLEDIHFSLGEERGEANSYGIYREPDSRNVVVYRVKPDGTKRIRYRGNDEAKAVEILYDKFFDELGKVSYGVSQRIDDFREKQQALAEYASNHWKVKLGIILVTIGVIGTACGFLINYL